MSSNTVWTANWQIWRQLAVLGKTVNCSRLDSELFYVNSKLARPTYSSDPVKRSVARLKR